MKDILMKLKKNGLDYYDELVENETMPVVRGREVLFLYPDTNRNVREVRLVHHISSLFRAPKFIPIGDIGIHGLHLVLPHSARMEYTFGITYSNGSSDIQTDPGNTDKAWCPFGPKSVVTTHNYHSPDWTKNRNGISRGTIESHTIHSENLGDDRTVAVYTPAVPPKRGGYPVLIIHDGSDYMNYSNIIPIFDTLISQGITAPFLAVLSDPINRNEEYSCTPQHPAFVARELLPWIRKTYPVSSQRSRTALMGASFGAVVSVFTAYHYPDEFGKLLIQSGSFRFQDLVHPSPLFEPVG